MGGSRAGLLDRAERQGLLHHDLDGPRVCRRDPGSEQRPPHCALLGSAVRDCLQGGAGNSMMQPRDPGASN